jgi:hypothetical protein
MRIYLCIVLIAICLFGACRKKKEFGPRYPEDTDDTYLSAADRLCDKWWVLDSATINGVDYTDSVFNMLGELKFNVNSAIHQDVNNPQYKYRMGTISTVSTYGNLGIIVFLYENSNTIGIKPNVTIFNKDTFITCAPHFAYPYSAVWEIRKLSENEFKIQFLRGDSLFVNYYK